LPAPDLASAPAAAALRESEAFLAWAGDSRAYLLEPAPALLTRDDSWLNEVVAAGIFPEEQAKRHPMAHAITCCLGHTSDDQPFSPHIEPLVLPRAGMLALCSDGLWNYAETADPIEDGRRYVEGCQPFLSAINETLAWRDSGVSRAIPSHELWMQSQLAQASQAAPGNGAVYGYDALNRLVSRTVTSG
jgi:serine/threonine protein phosphatase PrpC